MNDEEKKDKAKAPLDDIKGERKARDADSESDKSKGVSKPVAKRKTRRRAKSVVAEEIFPIEHWQRLSHLAMDGSSSFLGVSKRSDPEKDALAHTGRALAVKRIPTAHYAEEIMFGMVAIPITIAMLFEWLSNRSDKLVAINVNEESTRSDTGKKRERQDLQGKEGFDIREAGK